jgi:hypothetical protein
LQLLEGKELKMAVISKSHGVHARGSVLGAALLYFIMAVAAIAVAVPAAIVVMG